jgi:hypothetical protein
MPTYRVTMPNGKVLQIEAENAEALNATVADLAPKYAKSPAQIRDDDAKANAAALATDKPVGLGGYLKDIVKGAAGGAVDAITEAAISAKNFVGYAAEQSARRELERDGVMAKVPGLAETQRQVSKDNAEQRKLLDESIRERKDEIKPQAQTLPGKLTDDIVQFVLPFSKLSKAAKATSKVGKALTTVVASGAASTVAVDPYEEGLANLVQSQPALANPVTEFLAVSPDDTEGEARAKKLIEDVVTGVALDSLMAGLRALKARRAARATVNPEPRGNSIAAEVLREPDHLERESLRQQAAAEGRPVPPSVEPTPSPVLNNPPEPGTISIAQARRPGSAKVIAAAVREGGAGAFGDTVRRIVSGAADAVDNTATRIGGYNVGRIDWLSLGDDVTDARTILRTAEEVVAAVADEVGTARVSFEQTARVADDLRETFGINVPADALQSTDGLSAKLLASHGVLVDALKSASDIARKLKAAGPDASEALRRDLLKSVEVYTAVHAEVRGATAEVARAMANLRQMRKASEIGPKQFEDVVRELGNDPEAKHHIEKLTSTTDPARLNKELLKSPAQRALEMALELFYNSILSSPVTWVVNTASSLANVAASIPERTVAAGLGRLRQTLAEVTGKKAWATEGAMFVEAKAQLVGAAAGFKAGARALLSPLRVGKIDPKAWREAYEAELATVWGDLPVSQVDALNRKALRIEVPEDASKPEQWLRRAFNAMGEVIRVPTAIIKTTDDFVRVIAHESERFALAYREAELMRRTVGTADFVDAFGSDYIIGSILHGRRDARSDDIVEVLAAKYADEASDAAAYAVFQQEPGAIAKWLQGGVSKFPALRFVLPFIKTPANLFRWGMLERTPIGALVSRDIQRQLLDPGRVGDIARARMLIGTVVVASVYDLASDTDADGRPRYITGGRRKGRFTEDLDGVPPYSIKVGGEWVSYQRLDPFGMLLGLTADAVEISRNADDVDEAGLLDVTKAAIFAVFKNGMSKTWLQGVSMLVSALEDPDRHGEELLKNLVGGMVPFSSALRLTAGRQDEYAREAFGLLEKIEAQIPGARDRLPIKRDWLGRPVKSKDYFGPDFLSPVEVAAESKDPVDIELARLNFGYSMPDKKLDGVKLTSTEYSRLLELRASYVDPVTGLTLHGALAKLIAREDYKALPDDLQAEEARRVVNAYGRKARDLFVTEQQSKPVTEDSYLDRWQKLDEAVKQKWREQSEDRRADGNTLADLLKQREAA